MVGFNYRFHPRIARLRPSLSGITHIESRFTIAPRPLPAWKHLRSAGGGVLLDLGSHHVDLLAFLLGSRAASAAGKVWSEHTEEDCAEIELEFENGAKAACSFSFCRNEADVIRLRGPSGHVIHNRYAPLSFPAWPLADFAAYQWERLRSPWKEPSFRRSLAAWLDSIRKGAAPPVTIEDGLEALRVIDAAEQSAATGGAAVPVERPASAGRTG
jgi:myo-inositol 2-dehydrogenase/D-chiro-inositol 1-dehydrogenase